MAATTTYPSALNGLHNERKVEGNGDGSQASFEVAIIGGGIIGLMAALGLLRRGMRVTIYERADDFPEVGVGIAFTGVARDCMERLDPRVLKALRRVGEENRHPMNRYWDGFNPTSKEAAQSQDALLFQMSARELAYWGCLRSRFLREMAAELPEGVTKFGKQLVSYVDDEHRDKVILRFADGGEAEADAGSCETRLHVPSVPESDVLNSHWMRRNPVAHSKISARRDQPGLVSGLCPPSCLSCCCADRRWCCCPWRGQGKQSMHTYGTGCNDSVIPRKPNPRSV